jgi:NitT/TauT family transport system permease protein
MKVIGANSKQIFWHLRIPNAIPKCFDGLQTAVPLSIVGAIVSEMVVTSTVGLGHIFEMGARNVSPEMTFASLCILITFSTLLFGIFYLISLYVKRIIYGKTNS